MPAAASVATPARLLAEAVARDGGRPAVTFYDDATGERVELSFTTLENWVAKTANLLVDGLGLGPGARVVIDLPLHWLTPVWLLAVWSSGGVVVMSGGSDAESGDGYGGADAVVTGPGGLAAARASGADVVALSLRPLGAPFAAPVPAGVLDYGREVSGYGDRFVSTAPPGAAALEVGGRTWTQAELGSVPHLDLTAADRVLCLRPYDNWEVLHAGLLAPLRAGCGIVLVVGADPARTERLAAQERVTSTAGAPLPPSPC